MRHEPVLQLFRVKSATILDCQLEDPEVEAKYVFEGNGHATVVPLGGPAAPGGDSGGSGRTAS